MIPSGHWNGIKKIKKKVFPHCLQVNLKKKSK